jgi:hypothetical protein
MKKLLLYASIAAITLNVPAAVPKQQYYEPSGWDRLDWMLDHSFKAFIGLVGGAAVIILAKQLPQFTLPVPVIRIEDVKSSTIAMATATAFFGYHASAATYNAYKSGLIYALIRDFKKSFK